MHHPTYVLAGFQTIHNHCFGPHSTHSIPHWGHCCCPYQAPSAVLNTATSTRESLDVCTWSYQPMGFGGPSYTIPELCSWVSRWPCTVIVQLNLRGVLQVRYELCGTRVWPMDLAANEMGLIYLLPLHWLATGDESDAALAHDLDLPFNPQFPAYHCASTKEDAPSPTPSPHAQTDDDSLALPLLPAYGWCPQEPFWAQEVVAALFYVFYFVRWPEASIGRYPQPDLYRHRIRKVFCLRSRPPLDPLDFFWLESVGFHLQTSVPGFAQRLGSYSKN